MRNVLILGAGRSSAALIQYALDKAQAGNWTVTVADADGHLANQKVNGHPAGLAVALDVADPAYRRALIEKASVVVSLLPPPLHPEVAKDCVAARKHLVTASYVSPEFRAFDEQAKHAGLVFMAEMGLDPGIDHMSAMQIIHRIQAQGGALKAFRSYTGGLIAPESDNNPWHYKFTWNPRNVVLAGQGTAQYLEAGKVKYLPYNRLFQHIRPIQVDGLGQYEVYANRDSLSYEGLYGLKGIPSLLRGTIRAAGFCQSWNILVQLGLTDATYTVYPQTYAEWLESYLVSSASGTLRQRTAAQVGLPESHPALDPIAWLGLFDHQPIGLGPSTPAAILEHLLLKKWALAPGDKDLVLMRHEFEYELEGKGHSLESTLVMRGDNAQDTAMARLVGLPLGIFVRLLMEGRYDKPGVQIPLLPEVYEPVLAELSTLGVSFTEKEF